MRNSKLTKTTKLLTTFLIVAFLFTGCSSSSDTSENTKTTATETPSPTPIVTADPELRTNNIMGIYIGEQESQIGLGLETTSIKEVLGKADDITKNKKEKSQTWYYKNLDTTITFEKSGKVYTASSIKGGKKATTLKTGGGITVGATKQEVLDAYKDLLTDGKSEKKDKIVIENNGYSQIVFELDGDTVSGIVMELCK